MSNQTDHKTAQYYEKKVEYALGVLEMVNVLLDTNRETIDPGSIVHLNKIVPMAIKELKKV